MRGIVKAFRNSRRKDRPFFRRFLISYVFILIIPISTGIILFRESIRFVYREIRSSSEAIVIQATEFLNKSFDDIRAVVKLFSLDSKLISISMAEPPLSGKFYYSMQRVVEDFTLHVVTRSFIRNYFLYLPKSEYILSQNTAYQAEFFFEFVFRYRDWGYEVWKKLLVNEPYVATILPAAAIKYQSNEIRGTPSVWAFPLQHTKGVNGLIVFVIDQKAFDTHLERIKRFEGSSVYVTDENGQLIIDHGGSEEEFASIQDAEEVEGQILVRTREGSKVLFRVESEGSNLTFAVLTPERYILQRIRYIRDITLIITACTVVLGLFVAYYFATKNARPLLTILESLMRQDDVGDSSKRNPFVSLQSNISGLISANSLLHERLSTQQSYLIESTLTRIIKGEFKNREEISKVVEFLSLDLAGESYLVLSIKLFKSDDSFSTYTIEEGLISRLIIDHLLHLSEYNCRIFTVSVEQNEFALLLAWKQAKEGEAKRSAESIISDIVRGIKERYGVELTWGGGVFFGSLDKAYVSYDCSREAMRYALLQRDIQGIWYDTMPKVSTEIDYPIELENRIIYLINSEEYDSFEQLIRGNFRKNEALLLDSSKKKRYFDLLVNTFFRMNNKLPEFDGLVQKMKSLDLDDRPEDILLAVMANYCEVCLAVNARKKSHNIRLKEDILSYLEDSYTDKNLCLFSVSSQFGLSAGYLSHFFKEQTGVNFSVYLEKLRVEKAIELLKETHIQVQQIVERVGYANPYSFRRVFKKITGVSPSEFRLSLPL